MINKTINIDDKIAQTKISKIAFSANVREKRLHFVSNVG